MKPQLKIGLLVVVILGTLAWLAVGGINETKSYYVQVTELQNMGDKAYERRLRVAGDVEHGSIKRQGREVRFMLKHEKELLPVVYGNIEPLPDTFRDGAQAVCHGRMGRDGVFQATRIEAKCASKYEAKPGQQRPAAVKTSSL